MMRKYDRGDLVKVDWMDKLVMDKIDEITLVIIKLDMVNEF